MRGNEVLNFVLTSPHNHPEDFNELCILNFMDQLKTVCQSGIELSTKEIYDDIAKLWVLKEKGTWLLQISNLLVIQKQLNSNLINQ